MTRAFLPLSLWIALTLSAAAILAQPTSCGGTVQAGASLLFPYFEVDLTDTGGVTTLVSIQNTSSEPVLTHVVMWTNCAVPVLAFDLYLDAGAVRPIDLGALIRDGVLPSSGPTDEAAALPGCSTPLALPPVVPKELQAQLSGSSVSGLCYAAQREGALSVEGYLTADVVKSCPGGFMTPLDEGYFDAETGVAGTDNALWGEIFLVEEGADLAQGFAAVTLRAGGEPRPDGHSFYGNGDLREILPMGQTARYLGGGSFDGGTELLYWVDDTEGREELFSRTPHAAWNCVAATSECNWRSSLTVRSRKESGGAPTVDRLVVRKAVGRLQVGTDLAVDSPFGSVELCHNSSFPEFFAGQSWIQPVHTAEGRFSVGLRTRGECPFDEPETPPTEEIPQWLNSLINQFECRPYESFRLYRYNYHGEVVYVIEQIDGADGGIFVHHGTGGLLCAIYGNANEFDGCDDFFETATDRTLIWEDPR